MNLKLTHLVTAQFGIFIGIVCCLVFSRFELSRSRTAAETREPASERVAAVQPKSEPEEELAEIVDDRGELEPAEPLTVQADSALPTEYSPEAVEKSMAILTKLYYEQIAPKRKASTVAANTAVAPSYTEVAEEPAVVQYVDPAPQPVAYVQPTQVIVYPQPVQFIVFPQPRRFVNRCRPAPHPGAFAANLHHRRDGGGMQVNGSPQRGQHRIAGAPTCPSTQGFTPRGKR